MENINGSLACAYEILSSSVDDITNICALHEQTYFILADLQTKEKFSNRNRTQPGKLNHFKKLKRNYLNYKQKENETDQSCKKNKNHIARYF